MWGSKNLHLRVEEHVHILGTGPAQQVLRLNIQVVQALLAYCCRSCGLEVGLDERVSRKYPVRSTGVQVPVKIQHNTHYSPRTPKRYSARPKSSHVTNSVDGSHRR
jgi:hypothetical protein